MKSATEIKLEFICREIKELKEDQKKLREDINKGKGAVWILLIIAGLVSSVYHYIGK